MELIDLINYLVKNTQYKLKISRFFVEDEEFTSYEVFIIDKKEENRRISIEFHDNVKTEDLYIYLNNNLTEQNPLSKARAVNYRKENHLYNNIVDLFKTTEINLNKLNRNNAINSIKKLKDTL